jgi:hypothetical protein
MNIQEMMQYLLAKMDANIKTMQEKMDDNVACDVHVRFLLSNLM